MIGQFLVHFDDKFNGEFVLVNYLFFDLNWIWLGILCHHFDHLFNFIKFFFEFLGILNFENFEWEK